MPSKLARIRQLKAAAQEAEAVEKAKIPSDTEVKPEVTVNHLSVTTESPQIKQKKVVMRKCCGTVKGSGPHEASCQYLQPKKHKSKKYVPERLPHGAIFHAVYSAESESWTGTLTIEGCPEFKSTCSACLRLMPRLDELYRAWKKRLDTEKNAG